MFLNGFWNEQWNGMESLKRSNFCIALSKVYVNDDHGCDRIELLLLSRRLSLQEP